jgi:hypothetical protein
MREAIREMLQTDYLRLTLGLPRHGTCEQMPEFCAAAWPN